MLLVWPDLVVTPFSLSSVVLSLVSVGVAVVLVVLFLWAFVAVMFVMFFGVL